MVRGVGVKAFKIPSASMLPTLQIGDYVLVSKLRYGVRLPIVGWLVRFGEPQPGDVVVFRHRKGRDFDYVKRVIAVAGEVVEIRDKQVLVDGVPRDVPAAFFTTRSHVQLDSRRDNFGPVVVPPGRVFVLGDNRDQSLDSRFWGFVDVNDVGGKALLVYWSADGDDGWVRWERIGGLIP